MLAPNASALGPPGAKRGGGSSLTTGASRVVVAGDAQATTHTSSASAQDVGFTCPSFAKPLLAYPNASPHCQRCRAPRRALPRGAGRARWAVFHPRRVERGAPTALVVLRQLEVEALAVHPDS